MERVTDPAEFAFFPLRVRTFYRSYPTDTAIEIVNKDHVGGLSEQEKSKIILRYMPIRVHVQSRPTKEENNGTCAGMYVLTQVPDRELKVAEFKTIRVNQVRIPPFL